MSFGILALVWGSLYLFALVLLNKGKSEATKSKVVVGATYRLTSGGRNPFADQVLVKVKDCKEGWVLYDMLPEGGLFSNESMEEAVFLRIYHLYNI